MPSAWSGVLRSTPSPVDGGSLRWMYGATTCSILPRRLTFPSRALPEARSPSLPSRASLMSVTSHATAPPAPSSLGRASMMPMKHAAVDGQRSAPMAASSAISSYINATIQASPVNANDLFNSLVSLDVLRWHQSDLV